jgi:hypothetical protein
MADLGAEPRLVVPEGLMIDESARERLVRALAAAPETVVGIAGEISNLSPGTSYRVHAEWKSLEPWRPAVLGPSNRVRGAVVLRAGIAFAVRDGHVEITQSENAGASVLVDAGAPVHDPRAPAGPLQDASELGRPPFPRRPVVVFLGCDRGADAEWVRRLANRLVRRDIEARIALADAPSGLNLTRSCLPTEATIRALAPDVVVTLDDTAAARADAWCEGNRSTVIVAFDADLRDPMELVSWQLGRAQGRLRARIGPQVDVPAFAALVIRLCAGPQPIPPSDDKILVDARRPVRERWANRIAAAPPACAVLTGSVGPAARARVDGLVDNLVGSGARVELSPVAGKVPDAAREAAVVVLAGVAPNAEIDALIAARQRRGRPTVLDLTATDLVPGTLRLDPAVVDLARRCGRVVSPAGAVHAVARTLGVRTMVLPTLFTREFAAVVRAARVPSVPDDPTAPEIIGWHPEPIPEYSLGVASGIEQLLHGRTELEFVGDPATLPANLAGNERLRVVPEPDLEVIRRWAVQVWTPTFAGGELDGESRAFEVVSYLGVPSVLPAEAARVIDGVFSPFVLVESLDHPDAWADALHHVLDDATRRTLRTQEALRRADALDSPETASTFVNRFLGWATYRAEPRDQVTA